MRTVLALFVVLFIAAGIAALFMMQTELRFVAGGMLIGFATLTAAGGAILDEMIRQRG